MEGLQKLTHSWSSQSMWHSDIRTDKHRDSYQKQNFVIHLNTKSINSQDFAKTHIDIREHCKAQIPGFIQSKILKFNYQITAK